MEMSSDEHEGERLLPDHRGYILTRSSSEDDLEADFSLISPRRTLRSWPAGVVRIYRQLNRSGLYRRLLLIRFLGYALLFLVILTYIFRPSYTHLPPHYRDLNTRASTGTEAGRGNPHKERVFIAVTLYDKDGELASGRWGQQLVDLVDLIGPEKAFVSIYENSGGAVGKQALRDLEQRLACAKEVVYEEVDLQKFPHVTLPTGKERVKRIVYLSELRNRSLRPLDRPGMPQFDRILFLNDIYFDVVDALQLLFSTNIDQHGRATYVATCAIDYFFSPWKFYDLYATRDLDGYRMGWPAFPYFSNDGTGASRRDILEGRDAVRIKSCWSGMAAFDAKYIQRPATHHGPVTGRIGAANIDPEHPAPISTPIRFRAEPEPFADACECCLFMADVLKVAKGTTEIREDSGIYWNPYVRVAYHEKMLWKVRHFQRLERLFSGVQWLVNQLSSSPDDNAYRNTLEGDAFTEEIWRPQPQLPAGGEWEFVNRTGRNGLYCYVRNMQVLRQGERTKESNWINIDVPSGQPPPAFRPG